MNKSISHNVYLFLFPYFFFSACFSNEETKQHKSVKKDLGYTVAAYVWPSCHNDSMGQKLFWGEGIGEWEMIKKATPRFQGHQQPRVPLWGYMADDEPAVMEKKIKAATDYGVNTFIFDWYWYDGQPFLEGSVNAFMKARNSKKMNFYLMWANHDVPGNMWNHFRYQSDEVILKGTVNWDNFKVIVDRMIKNYFSQSNYFRIDGKPVLSIYHIANIVASFGGMTGAKEALDYFRDEVTKAGFPGLHLQLVGADIGGQPKFWGIDADLNEMISYLGVNSVTMYNMAGSTNRKEDYLVYANAAVEVRSRWDSVLKVPFVPCVSVGWDNTPRYPEKGIESVVHLNNTPDSFGSYLQKAKEYVDNGQKQPKLIIINAWNEWIEGSYLEPDMKWGYGYLESVKKVMNGDYETKIE